MKEKKKGNAVAVTNEINILLDDLCKKRSNEYSLIRTKVSIVADLIIRAHKKECKR